MKSENIHQIVQSPYSDAWIQITDEGQEIIYYERLTAFALMVDPAGGRRWATLTLADDGTLHEVEPGQVVFSQTQPDLILSEQRKKAWGMKD